ncbi:hypothetical protein LIER_29381 [Lithospermum erythrorhizon]|uniref:K+ potassium transporter integral membrane domain-containing protein n=1 Tax=Lithospermum erythrorhizon TaxID=34254 RepID=A0AAV3RMI7_LITER
MFKFLKKMRKGGWMSLGGILLCITGSEAMFADLGHFSYAAIQIAFNFLVSCTDIGIHGSSSLFVKASSYHSSYWILCFSSRRCEVAGAYHSHSCFCCWKSTNQ